MTFEEAQQFRNEHLDLKGRKFSDTKKKQEDTILDILVTPQDHPFYPEFLEFYKQTRSYPEASSLVVSKHKNEIIYAVKCVLDDLYAIEDDLEMHVLADLRYVLNYI